MIMRPTLSRSLVLIITVVLLLVAAVAVDAAPRSLIVSTKNGLVRGFEDERRGLSVYYGIPYAVPPVGDNRWRSPIPIPDWDGRVLDATTFPPGCPQRCVLPGPLCPARISEDCLYLNIWTPTKNASDQKTKTGSQGGLPVMVFIAGGAFEEGSGSSELYDGGILAQVTGTVVVTFSYRLGAFGFLVVDGSAPLQGNFGFEDQRVALRWIKNNIGKFGGDPNRVTVFGQSAGATSIAMHLMSPLSNDLFQQAIVQSSPWGLPFKTNYQAARFGATFASKIGCQKLSGEKLIECMRSKSMDNVLEAQYKTSRLPNPLNYTLDIFLTWTPTIDGVNVEIQPMKAFASGAYRKVPMMLGSTKEEGIMFIYSAWNHTLFEIEYIAALAALFKSSSLSVARTYPSNGAFRDSRSVLSQVFTDYLFTCPARQVANWTVAQGNKDIYFYAFDWVMSFDKEAWGPRYSYCVNKVCHGEELVYNFHSAARNQFVFTPDEDRLSCSMMTMWGSFAHTGDPNKQTFADCPTQSPVTWPQFDPKLHRNLKITAPASYVEDELVIAKYCDFWDGLGYRF